MQINVKRNNSLVCSKQMCLLTPSFNLQGAVSHASDKDFFIASLANVFLVPSFPLSCFITHMFTSILYGPHFLTYHVLNPLEDSCMNYVLGINYTFLCSRYKFETNLHCVECSLLWNCISYVKLIGVIILIVLNPVIKMPIKSESIGQNKHVIAIKTSQMHIQIVTYNATFNMGSYRLLIRIQVQVHISFSMRKSELKMGEILISFTHFAERLTFFITYNHHII